MDICLAAQRPGNNQLEVKIYYPHSIVVCPVIIWSPGKGFTKEAYGPLLSYWAGRGYVVIIPEHDDREGDMASAVSVRTKRVMDVISALDSLEAIQTHLSKNHCAVMDTSRIGVGGHSLGSFAAQVVGGVRLTSGKNLRDARPRAFLLISPQGKENYLNDESWRFFDRPAMIITGSNDTSPSGKKKRSWRLEGYVRMPPGRKYLVHIQGGWHGFGGITGYTSWRGSGPRNPVHVQFVQKSTLSFWDAFLCNDSRALKRIAGGTLYDGIGQSVVLMKK